MSESSRGGKFRFSVTDPDPEFGMAYLAFPRHPGAGTRGIVAQSLRLNSLLPETVRGADLVLDVDAEGRILGLEILLDDPLPDS